MPWLVKMLRRFPLQAWVCLAIAAVSIGSAAASVGLLGTMTSAFRSSVAVNAAWAARMNAISDLTKLAGDADAPGNNVFVSRDVAAERARAIDARTLFARRFVEARADLAETPPEVRDPLLREFETASAEFDHMMALAERIFAALESGDESVAAKHMAAMDQAFGDARLSLAHARTIIQGAQQVALAEQHRAAEKIRFVQIMIAVAVFAALLAGSAYGIRLAFDFAAAQARLVRQKAELRFVFDNVAQGLLAVDDKGIVLEERSRVAEEWLGPIAVGEPLWEIVGRLAGSKMGDWFRACFSQVSDAELPLELALDQLPTRLGLGSRALRIQYRPVLEGDKLVRLVLVISDVTDEERRAKENAEQALALAIFDRVSADRVGFAEFFSEAQRLKSLYLDPTTSAPDRKRVLHTLKGNCSIWGQEALAQACHELETAIATDEPSVELAARTKLEERWESFASHVRRLGGAEQPDAVIVDRRELAATLEAVEAHASHDEIHLRLTSWGHELAQMRLSRISDHARALARRLGKKVDVKVDVARNMRLPSGRWTGFFSALVHAVRNSLDHGIESPADRSKVSKGQANLVLRALSIAGGFALEVEDDGRGIDWEALRASARRQGLPEDIIRNDEKLLFAGGVSSAKAVTELSGRGIGMAALQAECEALGGHIEVRSTAGKGTLLRFVFRERRRAATNRAA